MKAINNKSSTFSDKSTQIFLSNMFFTEIFQNHILKVKIQHYLKPWVTFHFKRHRSCLWRNSFLGYTLLILHPPTWNSITGIAIIAITENWQIKQLRLLGFHFGYGNFYLSDLTQIIYHFSKISCKVRSMVSMATRVVEFSNRGYKINKVFA